MSSELRSRATRSNRTRRPRRDERVLRASQCITANTPSRRARRSRREREEQLEALLGRIDERIAAARATSVVLHGELAQWKERADRLEREVMARVQAKRQLD